MKVLAICGSGRKGGNTVTLLRKACDELEAEGIETEIIELAGHVIPGCGDCRLCIERKDRKCSVKTDEGLVNGIFEKMIAADGIILGSPVYFGDVTPEIKAVIDRTGRVNRANGDLLRRKVGAAVAVARRAGHDARLRQPEPLFRHRPDDHRRVELLERRLRRPQGRSREGR